MVHDMIAVQRLRYRAGPDFCSAQLRVRAKLRTVRITAFRSVATDNTKRFKLDRDEAKECSRKFRRTTFDHDQWAQHRSTGRYWRHLKSGVLSSRIVRGLAAPLIYVGVISFVVVSYETALKDGVLPDLSGALPWWHWPSIAMSISGPFSLSTFAMSLLLVFRTNGSYQRWNEARKLWGSMINRSRDVARQTLQWFPTPTNAELVAAMCRWTTAFPVVLMVSLRVDHTLYESLQGILTADELNYLMKQQHPGSAVLQMMGACVRASNATEIQKARIDENITFMQDLMGGCERIFRTPIPLSYTRHTSRFLMSWLSLLPFCVADSYGYMTVPLAIGMAFFLFGIEEIGVQIEEPFGILALEVFCDTIKKNIKQAQSESVNMQLRAEAYLAPGVAVAAPAAAGPAAMQPSPLAAAVAAGDSLSQELTQWLAAGGGGRVLLNSSSTSSTNGSSSSPLALDSSAVSGIVGGYPLLKHAEVINSSNSVLLSESILGAPAAAPPQQYQSHGPSKSCEEVYTGSQVSVGAAIDDGFTF